MTQPSDTLFRFMMVRPVQHHPDDQRRTLFLDPGPFASDLVDALDAAITSASRQAVAADYVRGGQYVPGFTEPEPWVAALRVVLAALSEATTDAQVDQAPSRVHAAVAGNPPLVDPELLATLTRRLWESLYAAYLSPRTDPRDRAELIGLLRALAAVQRRDTLAIAGEVGRLLSAQPVVPARWFSLGQPARPAPADPPVPAPRPDVPVELLDRLEQANALRLRYFALDRAVSDVRLVERRALAADTGRRPPQPVPLPIPHGTQELGIVRFGDLSGPGGQLPDGAVQRLRPETAGLVAEVGRDLRVDTVTDVVAALQAEQRSTAGRLRGVAGAGALARLDTVLKPTLTIEDLDMLPAEVPLGGGRFDEPYQGSVGSVRPAGVGDLLTVTQTLLGYELGEISYIENVLRTEKRERVFRQLDRVQTTFTTATQSTETSERDLQTTERFELQNETARTLSTDMSADVGVATSASYGPVLQIDANADFATSSASTDAQSTASTFARDVTDRSVASLTRTIQERTSTTTLTETEQTDTHAFDNTEGTDNVAGVYRWVNKRYRAQVMNYGKRLMMEMVVPDPSAFYHQAADGAAVAAVSSVPPQPLPEGFSFRDITPATYQEWTDLYQVSDVDPPPPEYQTLGKAIDMPEATHGVKLTEDYILSTKSDALAIVDGYQAVDAWVSANATVPTDGTPYTFRVSVGRHRFELDTGDDYEPMEDEQGAIPVAIKAYNVFGYALTVEVRYRRSDATLQAWQLATYKAVVAGYQNLRSAYDAQLAAAATTQYAAVASRSPDANRLVEREELRKGCIVLLTGQHFADAGAVTYNSTTGLPEIRIGEAMTEGGYLRFIEDCFESAQMTYEFYPYFWARKDDWLTRAMVSDPDPLFQNFLKAGAARVLLPVRRHWEPALIYFLETGQIWNGGAAPTINDPMYVSIVDEMQEQQDVSLEDAVPYGDPWEYTLPTTLVMLQADATLPVFDAPDGQG